MIHSSTGPGGLVILTADRADDRPDVEAAIRSAIARRERINVLARVDGTLVLAARVIPRGDRVFVGRVGGGGGFDSVDAAVRAAVRGFNAAFDTVGAPAAPLPGHLRHRAHLAQARADVA